MSLPTMSMSMSRHTSPPCWPAQAVTRTPSILTIWLM